MFIRRFILLATGGLFLMALFHLFFFMLQQEGVYSRTLGAFSHNYSQIETADGNQITDAKIPYIKFKDDDLTYWDAGIYKCISEHMYEVTENCYGQVKAAYYPLFPMLWRWTGFSAKAISLLNQLLFLCALILLFVWFRSENDPSSLITFLVLFSFPSVISYQIPYSESLFMLTGVILFYSIVKDRYGLYFSAAFLMAMVRPATVFVMLAVVGAEFIIFLDDKRLVDFLKRSHKRSLPFIIGNLAVILLQYAYTSTFTALAQARTHWDFHRSAVFTDWSVEGFGMSLFAFIMVFIPSLFFIMLRVSKNKDEAKEKWDIDYLKNISMLYFIGITFFILLTQGLDLHSYSRYILSSPFFFVFFLIQEKNTKNLRSVQALGIFSLHILAITLLLFFSNYGGSKAQYSWYGMYGSIASVLFLLNKKKIPISLQWTMGSVLIVLNLIWSTYLMNMFVSGAWIFT